MGCNPTESELASARLNFWSPSTYSRCGHGTADKLRPSVVVSDDRARAIAQRLGRGLETTVPSNVKRVFPFQALLPADDSGLRRDCMAHAEPTPTVIRPD